MDRRVAGPACHVYASLRKICTGSAWPLSGHLLERSKNRHTRTAITIRYSDMIRNMGTWTGSKPVLLKTLAKRVIVDNVDVSSNKPAGDDNWKRRSLKFRNNLDKLLKSHDNDWKAVPMWFFVDSWVPEKKKKKKKTKRHCAKIA